MPRNYIVMSMSCYKMSHTNPAIRNMSLDQYYDILGKGLTLPPIECLKSLDDFMAWGTAHARGINEVRAYVQINMKNPDTFSYLVSQHTGECRTEIYLEAGELIDVETRFQEIVPIIGNDILKKIMDTNNYTHHNIRMRIRNEDGYISHKSVDQMRHEAIWFDN